MNANGRAPWLVLVIGVFHLSAIFNQALAQTAVTSGYMIVTPLSATSKPLSAQLTLEQDRTFSNVSPAARTTYDAAIPASGLSDAWIVPYPLTVTGQALGVALVNPQTAAASVSMTLNGADGVQAGTAAFTIQPGGQFSAFAGQWLDGLPVAPFNGTLEISSSVPVALTALQFQNQDYTAVLTAATGSSASALIFPEVVFGGDWYPEIVLLNPNTAAAGARLDFFDATGKPWSVNLNGTVASSFPVQVPAKGTAVFTTPAQAALRSAGNLLAITASLLTGESQLMSNVSSGLAVLSASTLPDTLKAQFSAQLQTLVSPINAANATSLSLASQVQGVLQTLRNTQDNPTILQIQNQLTALSASVNANRATFPALLTQWENVLVSINMPIASIHPCPLLTLNNAGGCGLGPVPLPLGP